MTQRLDPGAGWYGEFLRRDPEGMRACLDGAAMPPWDMVESLLRDLAGARGAEFAARETVYAAQLRAAAVTVWDRLPGGEGELRTLIAAAVAQRAASQTTLRSLTVRLGRAADRAETEALTRELSWAQDDVARAVARHEDLAARLRALRAGPDGLWPAWPEGAEWLPGVPRQRRPRPGPAAGPATGPDAEPAAGPGSDPAAGPDPEPAAGPGPDAVPGSVPGAGSPVAPDAGHDAAPGAGPDDRAGAAAGTDPAPEPSARAGAPVGRAEGRWLRGTRRAGGARYAGSAAPAAPVFTPPPGHPDGAPGSAPGAGLPAPRGARFGTTDGPAPEAPGGAEATPGPVPSPAPRAAGAGASAGAGAGAVAAALLALRAQGRSGEAHALLCEAAARPAGHLPALAAELNRAGLAADWTTLLWEAASLPPERLAAAAAALGAAGREADCDALLRQGAARPAAEVAEAALALGGAGRTREADALLGAFVRMRTAEESAGLARHDPGWFAPRLLRAARALPGSRHRDLVHALRVAGLTGA
ncbi:hypothetical protein DEJ51_27455 [Streptomyces venezuelae]|uniref:UL36 very large tegument protein n=1 Tax=Streptomyces venezuelae TaxID=54571 RepID=A0A5P2DSC6_STRVZ|nr:hypothetical protein [Streptomyces venezuelae]QES57460.1 hypothetical protein DEJ51_27455 [Streptomyces venezuelae]